MIRKQLTELKRIITWLGFNYENGSYGSTALIYAFTLAFLITNSVFYIAYVWEEVDKRVDGLRGLVLYGLCMLLFMTFVINWDNSKLLLDTVTDGFYRFPYENSRERKNLQRSILEDMMNLNTIWYYGGDLFWFLSVTSPIILFLLNILKTPYQDVHSYILRTALPFYYPKNYQTLKTSILAYTLQSFFFVYAVRVGYVSLVSAVTSMLLIEGELKLIRLSVKEMDSIIATSGNKLENKISTYWQMMGKEKAFLVYLVHHHQYIYRKVNKVTVGMTMGAFALNSGLCIQLCTIIYMLVKRDEIGMKLQEAVFGCIIIFGFYSYGLVGEKVSSEDEKMRQCLYQSDWHDKPLWMKKIILLMMTRTTVQIEMKYVQLFVLNMKHFLRTVQAAYSYFNVLNNVKP